MESTYLGFSICNDGAGDNNLVFSALNGLGDVTPVFNFDRDTMEVDLLNDTTITGNLEVTKNVTAENFIGYINYSYITNRPQSIWQESNNVISLVNDDNLLQINATTEFNNNVSFTNYTYFFNGTVNIFSS